MHPSKPAGLWAARGSESRWLVDHVDHGNPGYVEYKQYLPKLFVVTNEDSLLR
jgi:hypothetical protein